MHLYNFKKFDTNRMISKELNKNIIKFFLSNKYSILKSNKIIKLAYRSFYFYKFSSTSFFRKACIKSGLCRSVFKFFKMSRVNCKFYANNGFFIGLQKASF